MGVGRGDGRGKLLSRRQFLALSSAATLEASLLQAQDRDLRVPAERVPFFEDQHPKSARGRELAAIARSMHIERGIEYVRRPQQTLKLTVYAPDKRDRAPLPVLLAFGLAAWVLDEVDYRMDLDHLPPNPTPNIYPPVLVSRGYAVVTAEVRVASEAVFPAQIQDCQQALQWLLANAASRGFDVKRVGLMGSSASGQLVSLLALMNGAKPLVDEEAGLSWPLPIKAVLSMSGFYDFVYYPQDPGDGTLWPQIRDYLGGSYEKLPKRYEEASPQHSIHSGAPPFFMYHGIQDRRVPYSQAVRFHKALESAHVPVEFESIDHYHHGAKPGDVPEPPYPVTDQRIYRFLDRHLKSS